MALRHNAFSFDKDAFQTSITPLVAAVDKGNLLPLYDEANKIIQTMSQSVWFLDVTDGSLLGPDTIDRFDFTGVPRTQPINEYLKKPDAVHPGDIGYWFLLVMSRCLEKSSGIGADYSILETALTNVGWSCADCELLVRGLSCCSLVRPDCRRVAFRADHDPYWHWIVPPHAQSSGWLPYHEVTRLLAELSSAQSGIRDYDPILFPNPWNLTGEALTDSQRDFSRRLQSAYEKAIAMLLRAERSSTGVFMFMAY